MPSAKQESKRLSPFDTPRSNSYLHCARFLYWLWMYTNYIQFSGLWELSTGMKQGDYVSMLPLLTLRRELTFPKNEVNRMTDVAIRTMDPTMSGALSTVIPSCSSRCSVVDGYLRIRSRECQQIGEQSLYTES